MNIFAFENVLPNLMDMFGLFGYTQTPPQQGRYQLWRIFTGNFTLTTMGELIFGTMLIYLFRLFERHWGSHKFAVCLNNPELPSHLSLPSALPDHKFSLPFSFFVL